MDENKEKQEDTIKGNKEEKYKVVYSTYGYLQISEEELSNNLLTIYNFIQYKNITNNLFNPLKGFIFKDNML